MAKVKCIACGFEAKLIEEFDKEVKLKKSEEMEEHEKLHGIDIIWEVVQENWESGLEVGKNQLIQQYLQTNSKTARENILKDLTNIKKLLTYDGYIDVFDCRAILRFNYDGLEITSNILKEIITEDEKEKLNELIMEAVEEQGAINWSGIYGITEELQQFVKSLIDKYKDKIEAIKDKLPSYKGFS